MNTKWILALAVCLCGITRLGAQGTAFTYQGRLVDQGSLPNATYQMEFSLHNALSGGARVAGPITNSAVAVSNGVFTVTINFGNGAFDGNARWLQIGVRTNGSVAAFGVLSPRQPVTPAPYAMLAGSLNGILPDSQLSANVPRLNANQTFSGNVSFTGPGNVGIGTSSPTDAKLDVEGNVRINDNDLFIRTGTDRNHGIGYRATVAGRGVDGPFVYGFNGGALGVGGPDSISLAWTYTGDVWVSNHLDTASLNVRSGGTFGGDVAIANPSDLNFGTTARQMLNLWGTSYGIGVQANTLYMRTDNHFAWFRDGVHNDNGFNPGTGGTNLMTLNTDGNLALNASLTVDAANVNNGSHYPGVVFGGGGETISSKRTSGGNQYGIDFYTGFGPRLSIANNGNIGINTTAPGGLLDINTGNGRMQFINDLVPGLNLTGGSIPGLMRLRNAMEVWPSTDGSRAGYIDVRATDGAATIQLNGANGEATVKVLTITGGADIAEPFQFSERGEIPKGSVVIIDDKNPGQLKMSDEPYDTRVAGIVSGANGVNPGIALRQQGVLEGEQNVALTGRVYALADASKQPIKPGDLLTTSDVPGHAMKASDSKKASGAILGKAMTGLKEGKGHVLVLVSLQ